MRPISPSHCYFAATNGNGQDDTTYDNSLVHKSWLTREGLRVHAEDADNAIFISSEYQKLVTECNDMVDLFELDQTTAFVSADILAAIIRDTENVIWKRFATKKFTACLRKLAACAVAIASKFEDVTAISSQDPIWHLCKCTLRRSVVCDINVHLMKAVDFNLSVPTIGHFVELYSHVLQFTPAQTHNAITTARLLLSHPHVHTFKRSTLAFGCTFRYCTADQHARLLAFAGVPTEEDVTGRLLRDVLCGMDPERPTTCEDARTPKK